MTLYRHINFVFLAILPIGLFAQTVPPGSEQEYTVDDPTNWDCASAMRLCSDTRFTFLNSDHGAGCLYFYFVLEESEYISITAEAIGGGHVQFHNTTFSEENMCAGSTEIPCPLVTAPSTTGITGTFGPGVVLLMWTPADPVSGTLSVDVKDGTFPCGELPCCDCLPTFQPFLGRIYVISAWCKLEGAPATMSSYAGPNGPNITVSTSLSTTPVLTLEPDGPIIDGWQRMEAPFTLPSNAPDLSIDLNCDGCSALFDDVRYFPEKSSMKCSVYDPYTLRLDAELDERHYATFYEYDGEGKLVRVKKETERGIMTIQETRYNSSKLFQTP